MDIIKNIVVGLDVSKNSIEILKRAFLIAQENSSKITILHAVDNSWFNDIFSDVDLEQLKKSAKEKIESELSSFDTKGIEFTIKIDRDEPSSLIVDTAKSLDASLIIIGENSKENFETKVFGTTAHRVAQNGNIPLLVIKNNFQGSYNNIVAFTDFSKISLDAMNFSKDVFCKHKIKVISVYKQLSEIALRYYNHYENKDKLQAGVRKKVEKDFNDFVETNKIEDAELLEDYYSITSAISNYVDKNQNDLVVLGSKGVNNANSMLYGSTSSYLMETIDSDILIYVSK